MTINFNEWNLTRLRQRFPSLKQHSFRNTEAKAWEDLTYRYARETPPKISFSYPYCLDLFKKMLHEDLLAIGGYCKTLLAAYETAEPMRDFY